MRLTRIAALVVAALLCVPATAQNIATLPNATALGGAERLLGAQGSGCPSAAQPCLAVSVTPAQIANYLAPTFQQLSPNLNGLAGITTAANLCSFWTGPATASTYNCAPFGRGLVGAGNAAAALAYLGASATGADPNYPKLVNGTDVYSSRSANSGAIFLGTNSQHYLFWDGAAYQLPGGLLSLTGNVSAAGASITAPSGAGFINFYVGSTNVGYVAEDQGSLYLNSPGQVLFRSNGAQVVTINSAGGLSAAGAISAGGAISAPSATLGSPLTLANGGTGSTTAAAGLAALGGQPISANLNAFSYLTTNTDLCPYWTGSATVANYGCLAYGRGLLGNGSAAATLSYLGASATGTDPNFAKLSGASFTGDIFTNRSANSGAIFFGSNAQHYLFWDGAAYQMPGGLLSLTGNVSSAGVGITAASGAGFLRFYTGSTATGYIAADTGTLYINSPNAVQFQVNGSNIAAGISSTGTFSAADVSFTGTPWNGYSPTVTCASGSLSSYTAVGRYKAVGKTITISVLVTIGSSGVGTCGGYMVVQLPTTAINGGISYILAGREGATSKFVEGLIQSGTNTIVMQFGDGTNPASNGASPNVTGFYETN